MTRAKKSKQYPAKYPNRWVLIATIRALKQTPATALRDRLISAFNQMGRGADARIIVGQAPGRGGNRKSIIRPFDIALEYERGRRNGMKATDACTAVRAKFNTRIQNNTIMKTALTKRALVIERLEIERDFDSFDD